MMIRRKKTVTGIVTVIVKQKKILALLLLGILLGTASPLKAQCAARNDAFQSGEQVMYELFFNWKFVWLRAGTASLTTFSMPYKGEPAYRINLLAESSKRWDFVFRMRDTLTCIVTDKLEPIYFRKGAEEGKRYYVDEAWFDFKEGLSYVNQKKYKSWTGEIIETQQEDSRCVYDMLSILAQARSFDPAEYKEGDRIIFPMVTGTKVEDQILIYRGKKEIKAENDTVYRCLVFSLMEKKGEKEKEIITFFITDDWNHLPVRLDLNLNFGTAKAFLKSVRGNRHPLSSIIKK